MALQVAIVGSGPAGCYLAERLGVERPDAAIDVLERLALPYGLVRYGVAPDHPGTRAISRVFDRLFQKGKATFLGGIEVGRDVTLSRLRDLYDVVVLATGAPQDRRLGIAGEDLPGVVPAGRLVGWWNGHPDQAGWTPPLAGVRHVVVVGQGNVALDVARLLVRTPQERAALGLPQILVELDAAKVVLVGRNGPDATRFAPEMLSELQALPGSSRIDFIYHAKPLAFLGTHRLEALSLATPDGARQVPADLAVTAIGFAGGGVANQDGRAGDRLYVAGWAGRGASGTIPTARAEAMALARRIVAEVEPGGRPGRAGLLAQPGPSPVRHPLAPAVLAEAQANR